MKKILAGLLMLAMVGVAHAAYWNVTWAIYDAFSPEATDAGGADPLVPSVLKDYSVTWSLVYCAEGANLSVDPTTGKLVSGTYTLIDQMTAAAGTTGTTAFSWNDGISSATYDETLYLTSPKATYLGDAPSGKYQVYQHILIENADAAYWWASDKGDAVETTTDTTKPVIDLGSDKEIGPSSVSIANAAWNAVTAAAVPEPATMSLLGLGALAMVLRRKLRK